MGDIRIISGQWRARKIKVIDQPGLRPSPNRLRETVFNWLQHEISGAHCLDMFAGSGSLGFEAASRGAKQVLMLEKAKSVFVQLRENQTILNAEQVEIMCQDSIAYFRKNNVQAQSQAYDIVFIDPPFDDDLISTSLQLIKAHLADKALVYVEHDTKQNEDYLALGFKQIKTSKAGSTQGDLLMLDVSVP